MIDNNLIHKKTTLRVIHQPDVSNVGRDVILRAWIEVVGAPGNRWRDALVLAA